MTIMIIDSQVRSVVAQDWAVVRKLCADSHRQYQAGAGVFINETPPETFYNLPLLLAYGILDQVLAELIDQGTIQCAKGRALLGDKMTASKGSLPWRNYVQVETGKAARNALAHEAKLLRKNDCLAYIDAIEVELKAWQVL